MNEDELREKITDLLIQKFDPLRWQPVQIYLHVTDKILALLAPIVAEKDEKINRLEVELSGLKIMCGILCPPPTFDYSVSGGEVGQGIHIEDCPLEDEPGKEGIEG